MTRTSKQLRRVQNEGAGVEKRLQQAEGDLTLLTRELERERQEHKDLSEQVGAGCWERVGRGDRGVSHCLLLN